MKRILILGIVCISTFWGAAQTGNDVYSDAAQAMCNCVNQSTGELSQRMIDIFIDSEGDAKKLEQASYDYATEDPEAAKRDLELMEGSMLADMSACFEHVYNDYEEVTVEEDSEEMEAKLIAELRASEECKLTVVFFKFGLTDNQEKTTGNSEEDEGSNPTTEIDSEHAQVASEVCSCIGTSAETLSDRMAQIFIDSEGDAQLMEKLIAEYVEDDLENAEKDADLLQGQIAQDIESCMSRVQNEYDYLYEDRTENEVLESLLGHLNVMPDCKLTVAVIQLGLNLDE